LGLSFNTHKSGALFSVKESNRKRSHPLAIMAGILDSAKRTKQGQAQTLMPVILATQEVGDWEDHSLRSALVICKIPPKQIKNSRKKAEHSGACLSSQLTRKCEEEGPGPGQ
jgi:hypothetical protein